MKQLNKKTKSNAFYTLLAVVKDFVLRNLESIPLCIALQYWYDADNDYKYWLTIVAVAACSGISTKYNIWNNNR
jgi:hypothetical protein